MSPSEGAGDAEHSDKEQSQAIPTVRPLSLPLSLRQKVALAIAKLLGWTFNVELPDLPKYLIIAAPHTSNWDLLYGLLLINVMGVEVNWVGKDSAFKSPIGWLFRYWGGIPVNRRERTNFVQAMIDEFQQREHLALAIAPEGTRSKAKYWKSGFYYIAHGAGVPIVFAYLDFGHKEMGVGNPFYTSDDLNEDFKRIQAFYSGIQGKHPERQGEIRLAGEQ